MPSINMIAVRRAEKQRLEQNNRKLVYLVVSEYGTVLLVLSFMLLNLVHVTGRIQDLNGQLATLEPQVAQIHDLQAQTVKLMPKVNLLKGARIDTMFWYDNFYAVTSSLPHDVWLTSMSTTTNSPGAASATPGNADGSDPVLALSGTSTSQSLVGEAMLKMNQAPSLDHADLQFVQSLSEPGVQLVTFQMNVHLKPEPAPAPPAGAAPGGQNVQKS